MKAAAKEVYMTRSNREKMSALASLLDESKKIVIVGHERADGDVIGSMVALFYRMRSAGKEIIPFLFEEINPRYGFLGFDKHGILFNAEEVSHRESVIEADVIIVLDTAADDRLPGWKPILARRQGTLVRIDHHQSSSGVATGAVKADIDIVDASACATSELIHDFLTLDGSSLSREEAVGIFVAILTDTGWFRYSNTTPRILRIGADLLDNEIDVSEIYRMIYQRNDLNLIRLTGIVASDIVSEMNGLLLWGMIDGDLIKRLGLEKDFETDAILDILRSSKDAVSVVLFRETGNGTIRVNMRSKGTFAVNKVAEEFGGGGHRNAAGITLKGISLEDSASRVVGALKKALAGTEK